MAMCHAAKQASANPSSSYLFSGVATGSPFFGIIALVIAPRGTSCIDLHVVSAENSTAEYFWSRHVAGGGGE